MMIRPLVSGWAGMLGLALAACPGRGSVMAAEKERYMAERQHMVESQIRARGVTNAAVLDALRKVPRHDFVPAARQPQAYGDHPLPIGHDQTISQPYIVAFMTELLGLKPGDKVLEIGTGSGYQAAVLAQITSNVFTIEIVRPLYEEAKPRLVKLGLPAGHIRQGDGYQGWPEEAPFDAIIVTAAPDHLPQPLVDQLKPGGRLVIPVGSVGETQSLKVVEKEQSGRLKTREVIPVRFVPLTREKAK
jgi:protein-L-isoaspartate(D-aspartate) O-methyltransferase